MIIVGLTGNYGMGKSTVLDMFRQLGAFTIDADEIVDRLLKDKSVLENIREVFGDKFFMKDGRLDRALMASLIFRDEKMRARLEKIVHPLVFERIEHTLKELETEKEVEGKVVVIEIPLMFESGRTERFHKTITVHADKDTVFRRLKERGVSRDEAESRMKAQMNIEEKIERSDYEIDNSGDPDQTRSKVREIYDRLLVESGT